MNYIKHLTGFFEKVAIDKTLNPTHVSLYIALFQFWNCNRFKNPISINRDEVMRISKISSKATYHKCLKNLHNLGYINYEPSYNPFKGSHVHLFNFSDDLKPTPKNEKTTIPKNETVFEPVNELVLNQSRTSSDTTNETSTEQALVSYINNTNIPNNSNDLKIVNLDEQAKKNRNDDNFLKIETAKKEKSSAKKEMFLTFADSDKNQTEKSRQKNEIENSNLSSRAQSRELNPTIDEIKNYFQGNNFPELEAQKFFNYFSSVGWLVGGKTPMVDWQAAAQNWILNSINFNHNTDTTPSNNRQNLNATTDKNYAEPL
nr:transcriptional regulator [uncultured Flavobacterium sp.]